MKRLQLIAAVLHYFTTHSKSEECFATSDGQIFHKKHDAEAHAHGGIKDGHVAPFSRKQVAELKKELEDSKPKVDEGKEAVVNYSKMKKADLQALLKEREIAFEETDTVAVLVEKLQTADAQK